MTDLLSSSTFWMTLSIGCYALGVKIQQKTGSPLCNPLLISAILVGALLVVTGTSYQTYESAGQLISFFLTPATVALAVPIYRKLDVLKKNLVPILAGALVGSLTSILSVLLFCRLFGLSDATTRSLIPKSVTTPIGVALSEMLGGLAPIPRLPWCSPASWVLSFCRLSSSASVCATPCKWACPSAPPPMRSAPRVPLNWVKPKAR